MIDQKPIDHGLAIAIGEDRHPKISTVCTPV